MKHVTKKASKSAREFAAKVLNYLHKELKVKYIFSHRLVGSAVWNTIIKDNNGFWDLDYQILLTRNSKEHKNNNLSNPTQIKHDFFNCIDKKFKNQNGFKVENSTTAITLINYNEKYSIDFVIIRLYPENHEIIRRNNKKNSITNEFTWNELPKFNDAYRKFKNLAHKEKQDLIENYILPRKEKEKANQENDSTKRSSCEIFVEEVNNYVDRKRNCRL